MKPTFCTSRVEEIAITDMGAEQANDLLVNRAQVEHLTDGRLAIHRNGQNINPLKGLKHPTNSRRRGQFPLLIGDLFIIFLQTQAPHGADLLEKFQIVGVLIQESG
jgi:hypothetical protein